MKIKINEIYIYFDKILTMMHFKKSFFFLKTGNYACEIN